MSLHIGIRRPKPKHRAVDKVADLQDENRRLRGQLIGAHDYIALADGTLADVRAKRAEAEQVVVCLDANLKDRTEERDQLLATVEALRAQLAPYLAADANRDAITVPEMVRDTTAMEDQSTGPIDVKTLWEAHGISPAVRIADPCTPTWVPAQDSGSETTQSFRVVAA